MNVHDADEMKKAVKALAKACPAIKRAHKTITNLSWFEVVETRGNIDKGKVHHWQVTIKVGFVVKD